MAVKTKKTQSRSARDAQRIYPTDGFANAKEAGEFLSLSERTIYRMIEDDQIANAKFRDGEAPRIPWAALHQIRDEALEKAKKKANSGKEAG